MSANVDTQASGLSDANGNVTIPIPQNPGIGYKFDLNVSITNSPPGGTWIIKKLGTQIGNFSGTTIFGPVTIRGQETLNLIGSGLQPNTTYIAHLLGTYAIDDGVDAIPHNVPTSVVPTETTSLIVNAQIKVGGGTVTYSTVTPPSNCRRVTVIVKFSAVTGNEGLAIVGHQTGIIYGGGSIVNTNPGPQYYAIEPTVDASYDIIITNTQGGASITCWVLASQTNPFVLSDNAATPVLVLPSGQAMPVTFTPNGQLPTIFSQTFAANGTTNILPARNPAYAFVTAAIFNTGNMNIGIAIHGTTAYLALVGPGQNIAVPLFGLFNGTGIDVIVSGWVSGAAVATLIYQ